MNLKFSAFVLAVSVLSGCARMHANVPPDIAAPAPLQGIVVLYYNPVFYDAQFRSGSLNAGETRFKSDDSNPHYWKFSPSRRPDGFIVMQLPGDGVYALTASVNHGSGFTRSTCNGAPGLVFKAPAGKVLYLGSVDALPGGQIGETEVDTIGDLEGARTYLAGAFPALASQLQPGNAMLRPLDTACPKTVQGYILIPGPNGQSIQLPVYK